MNITDMKALKFFIILPVIILTAACKQHNYSSESFKSQDILKVLNGMTDLMVHDITNPPLASRFFAYACIAGYEVVSQNDSSLPKLHRILNKYPAMQKPDSIKASSYQLSALLAMIETARKMQPSGSLLLQYENQLLDSCRIKGFAEETINQSMAYAVAVSKHVLAYAKADGYNKISNYPRYTPDGKPGSWYPTPPAYMTAVEPFFNTVRPFTLDTCSQFQPVRPVEFSVKKNSDFYRLAMLNYKDSLTEEHQQIAAFWDCNPFAVQDRGHLLIGVKKISPGAHWIGITGIACGNTNKSFEKSMQIFTTVSVGLMDGFICCWDEKFRSNRIRPETAIRRYIDSSWVPFLQTPPFPEYLSGHSVVSATSATILSSFFGNNFSYTDTVELRFGLPPRHFNSFNEAAKEAAISRFYGGIHFMDAIDNGLSQGEKIGKSVILKMK